MKSKQNLNALEPGYRLHWYEIREILGQGGFGITYLAYDTYLNHEVAIKEYLPVDLSTRASDKTIKPLSEEYEERYEWGLKNFIHEGRTIVQFKHPNIVRVRNVFEANNTAYMVMDYELGETLQELLSRRKILQQADIEQIIFPIIDGIKLIHAHGFIHRDIKPSNIFIRVDSDPVLLDFGSARRAMEKSDHTITTVFSKGYAPIEQYNGSDNQQGPWTDIYALGATLYRCISGIPPCDAIDRSTALSMTARDTYVSAVEVGENNYASNLLEAIDYAMQFRIQDRPQSIAEWEAVLNQQTQEVPPAERDEKGEAKELKANLKQAKQGDASAQAALAFMYAKGIGTHKDEREAAVWYKKAAEQGHLNSQFNLGVIFAYGRGIKQDYAEAFKWYKKAAEQEDTTAMSTLAMMYIKGVGTKKSRSKAFKWYHLAGERGHINSMYNLGEMYAKGIGVKQDNIEAFKWYNRAATQGHVNAQLILGYMYGKGKGVTRNDTEAYHWYRKAADSGHPNAQYNLGVIYSKGRGVTRNVSEAIKWYQKAVDQGDQNAQRALEKLI